jgi:phenylpropionate dioxygenase-like ring-hydroxylating dioxygenase large terminal subunit
MGAILEPSKPLQDLSKMSATHNGQAPELNSAFLRNCWYVAAWDHEILADVLFERTILGESVLFYRTASGQIVALNNKCCHRHAPLSLGRKDGDCVRCMYHGLKFDPQGRCVDIPGQSHIPSTVRVRAYPVVDRKRWVWIWMGDPALADAAQIPDTFSLQDPGWSMKPGYLRYDANHLLISDNLLDFSHLSFVHEGSLGGTSRIAETRPSLERLDRGLRLTRRVSGSTPAPYHIRLGAPKGLVDRWWIYDYIVPGVLLLDSGVQPAESTGDPAGRALRFHSCQAITPETARSTHYFFTQAHSFSLHDATVTEALYQSVMSAFQEDRRIIEAQQRLIDRTPAVEMVGLPMDGALGAYRKIYQTLLGAEVDSASPS